ncbi:PQQ-dependent sugar dehydrogenase [Acaryochloris thomasi]|nr:PQQ-dependent sugar dehydrogenase [Acaryochloris thomasi]
MRTRSIATVAGLLSGICAIMGCAPAIPVPSDRLSPQADQLPIAAVKLVPIVTGLEHPWGMAWLPDDQILITERPGRLRLVKNGKLAPEPIKGVTAVSTITAQQLFATQQGGLMDIAIHPRFADNRWVYFTYSHGTRDANRTRVARAQFDGQQLDGWQVIFEVAQTKRGGQHFGSRLTWLPDETLLISIGDGGNPPVKLDGDLIRKQAQNRASHLGKVIRIKDDGTIPADNPYVSTEGAAPAVWSYGHRNIQGLTYDPMRKRVWATEHGSRGGDELNWVQSGKNYGWPVVSFSQEYTSNRAVAPATTGPEMVDPKRVWTPSIAPSGLAIYTGDQIPQWRGNLFAGGLVSRSIRRLELDESGSVTAESQITIGQRVRDIRQGPDGYLYVLTDANSGQLLRLEVDPNN